MQDEWTALYRYENAADLDKWLVSDERKELLAEGEKFADFHSRTIDNSFGSWFAFDEHGNEAPPPSDIKTSHRGVGGPLPDGRAPDARAVAAAHAAVAGPARRKPVLQLRHELRDDAVLREPAAEALAAATAGCARGTGRTGEASASSPRLNLFWVVVFYLVTRVFWHLP